MRIKIDECLPLECADLLGSHGHEVETVPMEGLQGKPDHFIWSTAQAESRFLITTDLDFSDIRRYKPGKHHGVLLIRLHSEGKPTMLSYLEWLLDQHEIGDWARCLVIATDHKVRVKRQRAETPSK